MTDETYTFEQTRTRLEEILVQVRKKDTSLEQSLELLEEGVRLANMCNELIDKTSWEAPRSQGSGEGGDAEAGSEPGAPEVTAAPAVEETDGGLEGGDVEASEDVTETDSADAADVVPDDERA
jgi:exodeoxyribonuclease VII small subunit